MAAVGLGLIHLQLRADVAAYVHIRDIDGKNFKRRARVKALAEHGAADQIWIFEHGLVRLRRADGRHDALADTRDDRLFARAADQPFDIRTHGHARLGAKLDAVLRNRGDDRRFDDLRVDAHLHGLQHVAARQIDGARFREVELDVRAARGNQRGNHAVEVAAREKMRFHFADLHIQPGLFRLNQRPDDLCRGHAADTHAHQRKDGNMHAGSQRGNPQIQRNKTQKNQHRQNNGDQSKSCSPQPFSFPPIPSSVLFTSP